MVVFWSATEMALHGFYAAIVEKGTIAHVVRAMMQQPYLQYWSLLGHGKGGGAVAARMAFVLHPKIKALILLAAALPEDVDLRSLNLLLTVIYGGKDTVVSPQAISKSFSQMAGMHLHTYSQPISHHLIFLKPIAKVKSVRHLTTEFSLLKEMFG
jgi:hypothetical protein